MLVEGQSWVSPDNRIKKVVLTAGSFGSKPSENCLCVLTITDVQCVSGTLCSEYIQSSHESSVSVSIGESNTALDRELDKCISSMHRAETSSFVVAHAQGEIRLTVTLNEYEFRGHIYEWDAKTKYRMAQAHKAKGIELFHQGRHVDASHRFSRGLKLLLSVPESVEEAPDEIDGVARADLHHFRANLYNNLASCYMKVNNYDVVVSLCTKVIDIDKENVKALHKRGLAYTQCKNFDKAKEDFVQVLKLEPHNKAAQEKLEFVDRHLGKQEKEYASIVKKMFSS